VFLEADELAALFEEGALAALRNAVDAAGFGDAVCPRCAKAMRAFPLTHLRGPGSDGRPRVVGVEVDGCATCGGMWFDAGEAEPITGEGFAPRAPPSGPARAPASAPEAAPATPRTASALSDAAAVLRDFLAYFLFGIRP
jgi:hypothetical protein